MKHFVTESVISEIQKLAFREGMTKTEAIRRILTLVKVSNEASKRGCSLGIIHDHDGQLDVVAKTLGV